MIHTIEQYILENNDKLYRIAYGYVKQADDAMDIVQDAIFKMLTKSNTLKNKESIKTWAYRIVVNTALDFLRKHKKVIPMDINDLPEQEAVDFYQDMDLQKAIDALPFKQKTIIMLRFYEDLDLQEIASITGDNLNTIKSRLYNALDKLKITYQKEGSLV